MPSREVALPYRQFGPRHGLVKSASVQVAVGDHGPHVEEMGVIWAQAHGLSCVLYCRLRLTQKDFHPTAEIPSPSQVWIEHEGLLNKLGSFVNLPRNIGQSNSSAAKRNRVLAYGRPIQSIDASISEDPVRYVEVPRKSASAEAWLNEVGRPMIGAVAGADDDERKH
jgi:hypothetical protein